MTFGERLKAIREQKGLSQRELGERLGVRQQTIAQYEKAVDLPKMKTIEKIAKALNISTKELLGIAVTYEPESTLAAHFDGDEYTEEELNEIRQFAAFVKSKRNTAPPDQEEPGC